ncbi:MAG TPA: hypothetical protein VI197_29675 [Polyangiaceae bacterium]
MHSFDSLVPPPPSRKTGLPWWGILLIVVAILVPACGVLSALGIYGVRKYMLRAKQQEAQQALPVFAEAVIQCADSHAGLPRTSTPVPASLADVSGRQYRSTPSEWTSDPTLACSGFSMSGAQYFQYQWVLHTPSSGTVQASADLDGDGAIESHFRLRVDCVDNRCTAAGEQARR